MSTKILFVGDVFLRRPCALNLPNYPLILNLEAPISNKGNPIEGKINLIMEEGILEGVFDPLPVAVSLANNHIMDFGNEAFENTLSNLQKLQIKYFGAGKLKDNYNNPLIMKFDNLNVAFLGYCYSFFYEQITYSRKLKYGPAPLEMKRIYNDITDIKNEVDRIVVSIHWGHEESNYPDRSQVEFARKVIDMGADYIYGHHPHAIQPIEKYQNKPISYSLGNFIFPDLDLPAYFNKEGNPSSHFKKIQYPWNKASIGMIVDFVNLKYKLIPFYFNNTQVIQKKNFFHNYATIEIEHKLYKLDELVFQNLRWKKLSRCFLNFIRQPKIPSIDTFMALGKIFKNKNNKKKWFN